MPQDRKELRVLRVLLEGRALRDRLALPVVREPRARPGQGQLGPQVRPERRARQVQPAVRDQQEPLAQALRARPGLLARREQMALTEM